MRPRLMRPRQWHRQWHRHWYGRGVAGPGPGAAPEGGDVPLRMRQPASRRGTSASRGAEGRQRRARRVFLRAFVLCALAAVACSKGGPNIEGSQRPASGVEAAEARRAPAAPAVPSGIADDAKNPGLPAASAAHSPTPQVRNGIAWYEDAPEPAFAAARASGKRVVVDLWAPWCHTCLSMQNVVMTAANLPAMADRFVWLAIDTEREENASLLERLPVSVWPTFYVVDAGSADAARVEIRGRWLGAASTEQFSRFLAESDRPPPASSSAAAWDVASALATADALAAQGRHSEAAAAYGALLERAPQSWPRRPETLVALMTALWKAKDIDGCMRVAERSLGDTGNAASAVDFSSYALECAAQAQPGAERRTAVRRAVALRLEPACKLGTPQLSPDDRADACDKLAAARAALGDTDGAQEATRARLAVLERAAAKTPPELLITYDWARTDALLQLGRAEEALAIATERELQLPQNYNPPHYRAKSFKALGRWTEGLAAIDRALSLAYGPRKIGLLSLKADLLLGAGRDADALATLRDQLAQYRTLPAGQRQPGAEARVEQRLRELEVPVPE
jgi:thioredoxin-like negative regulator of GroEL